MKERYVTSEKSEKAEAESALAVFDLTHPAYLAADVVKLAFQASFGGEHLAPSFSSAKERIEKERADITRLPARFPALEHIGFGVSRMDLCSGAVRGVSSDALARIFISSAGYLSGRYDKQEKERIFKAYMCAAAEMFRADRLRGCRDDLVGYIDKYVSLGIRPVSHSDLYKKLYAPSYRVVSSAFFPLLGVIKRAEELIEAAKEEKRCLVIGIDGRAASGKTTCASLLSGALGAPVVHMDDFFLPGPLRTPERFASPGGNVHYERFFDEVIRHVKKPESFSYGVFDCSRMEISPEKKTVPAGNVRIIEGVYSFHPYFGDIYDIKLFMSVTQAEQKRRILERGGEEKLARFQSEWIPLEEAYFSSINAAK